MQTNVYTHVFIRLDTYLFIINIMKLVFKSNVLRETVKKQSRETIKVNSFIQTAVKAASPPLQTESS